MKKVFFLLFLLPALVVSGQTGYEIKLTFKPFKNQYVFLGHYFGKQSPIVDSVKLDENSTGVFRGKKNLPGGIYMIGYPNKSGFFEFLLDKNQRFSIIADTATLVKGASFLNSSDNVLFTNYQQTMGKLGKDVHDKQEELKGAKSKADSSRIQTELEALDKKVTDFRNGIITKNQGTLLSALLVCMREPVLTGKLKDPKTHDDSIAAYRQYKDHYWDGVKFYDGRLAYTPFFDTKVDKYFNQLVVHQPDSVIKELDYMLGFSAANPEMNRFLLVKFVNRYLMQQYMYEDAVFVHLYEKYFSNKEYDWLTAEGKKIITDRAYSLMANIMGNPASDVELPDTAGKKITLYSQEAKFMVVAFWDPTCSHCKEMIPRLDSFYRAKWKAEGVKVYSIAKETDGTRQQWLDFLKEHNLYDWTNVYYSKAEEKSRVDNGIPSYSQFYDVLTFPTFYLLDKEKRIVAKKLALEQYDEIIDLKLKGQ